MPDTCVHHWVIESLDGRKWLKGVCKKCHATRDFLGRFTIDSNPKEYQDRKARSTRRNRELAA